MNVVFKTFFVVSLVVFCLNTHAQNIGGVINNYTPVIDFLPCENKIVVTDGTLYNINDTILIIQMKGAIIDTTNTPNFGNILDYKNAGNYEYNFVKQRVGNVIELKNSLSRNYNIPIGKVQLVRVPYYTNVTVSSTLTCQPWNGTTGGVLALNVRDTLYMNADGDVSGMGFRGGREENFNNSVNILPIPIIIALSANDVDCDNGQSQLTVSGAWNYIWTPVEGLNNAFIQNPIASPIATTIYKIVGKDQNGCIDSSFVTVNVSYNGKSAYYMPNAFTPNGDGLNDCFGIKNWGQINSLQFMIYNRLGEKIFYTENSLGCWDGTYKGQQQPADNYIYYIKANTVCGTTEKSGNIILIR